MTFITASESISVPFRFRSWSCKSHVYYPCIVIFSSLCCHVYDLTQPTLKMIMLCSWYLQAPLHDALRVMFMAIGQIICIMVLQRSYIVVLVCWTIGLSYPPPSPSYKICQIFFGNHIILFKREENSNIQCVDLNHS